MLVFFFKKKTAYEMRISDWSSDVCSSDLAHATTGARRAAHGTAGAARAAAVRLAARSPAPLIAGRGYVSRRCFCRAPDPCRSGFSRELFAPIDGSKSSRLKPLLQERQLLICGGGGETHPLPTLPLKGRASSAAPTYA